MLFDMTPIFNFILQVGLLLSVTPLIFILLEINGILVTKNQELHVASG